MAAAVSVARGAGLRGLEPVVLRDAWHVLVHLRPFPIVARASTNLPFPDGMDPQGVVRELAVARHAAAGGAPVVPPSDDLDPGPHERDGHGVVFWRFVESSGEVDPRAAGRGLREIHDALADYRGDLPPAGHPGEMTQLLDSLPASPDVELLRRAASSGPAERRGQALHGDAHLYNCLATPAGVLWHDFETACHGPREYDLAALVLPDRVGPGYPPSRAALAAYGDHDADLVDAWLPVYGAWVWVSMLTALPRRPELEPGLRDRLAWLRRRLG